MTQRWRPWLLGLLLLQGCSSDDAWSAPGERPGPSFISADGGVCARPEEGCICEPDQPPIDCYLDPIFSDDGRLTCQRGTRYCRGGAWTACESVTSYELRSGPGIAALVTGPTACNPCDPACAVSRDIPSTVDLPGRSRDVSYDPVAGGVALTTIGMPPPPPTDSDGDGVPDFADECVGPGAIRAADGSCFGGTHFYFSLPFGGPTQIGPLPISVQVRTADIYFLMDTTGSMGGEIANLQRDLTTGTFIAGCSGGIIGAIRCTIPDAWFGVGYFDDYPVSPYGGIGDDVYRNLRDLTADITATQTAVNSLALHFGGDGPESQTQALWAVATGWGLGPYLSPRTGCPAGRWGYPCFRNGTIPIIVMFTDAPFHNGPFGYPYEFGDTALVLPTATAVTSSSAYTLPTATSVGAHDSWATARDVGDAASSWTGWSGNTSGNANSVTTGCGSSARDTIFRFTVSTRREVLITTEGSSFDTVLSLRNSGFGEIVCNDDAVGTASVIQRTLDPGTYFVVVTGFGSAAGSYRLSIGHPPRPGDSYATAWMAGDAATTWTSWSGTTCSHLRDDYTSACGGSSPDGVFRFTVSSRTTVRLTTTGSGFDTMLSLRSSSGSEIACNDDSGDLTSSITATLDPGTYFAVVEGFGTACGNFRLTLGVPPGPAVPLGYPISWASAVSELNRTGIRVITVQSGEGYGIEDANALADATGSVSGTGARYVFPIAGTGTGLSGAVASAIVDLAQYSRMDISARSVDNTATAINERGFVQSITAVPGAESGARCAGISGGTTFVQCLPGTRVNFNVAFRNNFVEPTATPQVFDFWIEVVGDGTFVLERIPVRIVVPPSVPLYPPSGSYWRNYDSTAHCASTEAPDWNALTWDAPRIPEGTSIRWEIRTAASAAGLDTAVPVTFTTPPTSSPADIGSRLVAAGQRNGLPHLRVTAVLLSNTTRTETPVLRSFELRYACIPTE
jgi:hypothetical protein